MVELQLETYTRETVSAHGRIRQASFPLSVLNICISVNRSRPVQASTSASLPLPLNAGFFSGFREKLSAELKSCQAEKQSVELKLSSFEVLGKEFEALAEEYCRLRKEIELKNWALKEFTQYSNQQS